MSRVIKFRGYSYEKQSWMYGNLIEKDNPQISEPTPWVRLIHNRALDAEMVVFESVGQATGLKDKNGVDVFEGDVFRIEESSEDEDRIFYVVITWVKEWCMFCSLLVDDEYFNYLNDGIEALDEPMFWTYTLEDTDSKKHFLCGNIYQHPHLLNHPSNIC